MSRKPQVCVVRRDKGHWAVCIEAFLLFHPGERRTVMLANYKTRDSANEYAKGLRRALRGER